MQFCGWSRMSHCSQRPRVSKCSLMISMHEAPSLRTFEESVLRWPWGIAFRLVTIGPQEPLSRQVGEGL